MYGFLDQAPSGTPFIALCFAVRIVGAVGTGAIMTASFAIAGNCFPDRIGTVYGILETFSGTAFLIGPAAGGGLYQLGGFGLPFWVFGGFVFLCILASATVLPTQTCRQEEASPSSFTLLRSVEVLFGSACLVVALLAFAVWEPVYSQHLEQFDLSESVIGLIFVVPAATYTFTTPIWGLLLDRNVKAMPLMVAGLCCGAVSLLFFGPAPFLTFITPTLWLSIVTIAALGLSLAPVVVSSMRCIVDGARDFGFKDDESTFGLVGGIVQSANCLGTFVGPLIGGALTDQYGFALTMSVSSVFLVLPIIGFCPVMILSARRKNRERAKPSNEKYIVLKGENTTNNNITSESVTEQQVSV